MTDFERCYETPAKGTYGRRSLERHWLVSVSMAIVDVSSGRRMRLLSVASEGVVEPAMIARYSGSTTRRVAESSEGFSQILA